MPRSSPDATFHQGRRRRVELDTAGRNAALSWLQQLEAWTTGGLCRHLIDSGAVLAPRGLLIEAYAEADTLMRELIDAGRVVATVHTNHLIYSWRKTDG